MGVVHAKTIELGLSFKVKTDLINDVTPPQCLLWERVFSYLNIIPQVIM